MQQVEKVEGFSDIGDSIVERRSEERYNDQHCYGRNLPGVERVLCTIETFNGTKMERTLWVTYEAKRGLTPIKSNDLWLPRNHYSATTINIMGIGFHPDVNLVMDRATGLRAKNLWIHDIATYIPSNEKYLAKDMYVTIPGDTKRRYFKFVSDLQKLADDVKAAVLRKKALEEQISIEKQEQKTQSEKKNVRAIKDKEITPEQIIANKQNNFELFKIYLHKQESSYYIVYGGNEIGGVIGIRMSDGSVTVHRQNVYIKDVYNVINKWKITELDTIPKLAISILIKEGVIKTPMKVVVDYQSSDSKDQKQASDRVAEEMARINKEIEEKEIALQKALQENKEASIMWHSEYEAREIPGLNPHQENARVSHLYDGVPLVIEGGPGTGKTTILVQRVNFLLSADSLYSHPNNLTDEQKRKLTDEGAEERNWLFLAPNQMLLNYLQNSMIRIGLQPNPDLNTKTIATFRSDMMLEYKLTDPAKKAPFLEYKPSRADRGRALILRPIDAISEFGQFFVKNIRDAVIELSKLNTSHYSWHSTAQRIKAYCKSAEKVEKFRDLYQLFLDIQRNLASSIEDIEKSLKEETLRVATIVRINVQHDEKVYAQVKELFEEWQKIAIVVDNSDVSETELEEILDEEEEITIRNLDYELLLLTHLKRLLPKVGLKKYISVTLNEREQKFFSVIEKYIKECNLDKVGELKLFGKKYSQLCKGVESNVFGQLVRTYKVYRKNLIKNGSESYDMDYLSQIIKKDNNKRLHVDEVDLLIGIVNNMIRSICKSSPRQFEQLRNQKYIAAYKENIKYVIAVDEATDYSLLDYYMIASFLHYEVSAISLCGDLMQGLNDNGIKDWRDLEKVGLENLDINILDVSYRQSPTLLAMSKQMYLDEMGVEAPYNSCREIATYDAIPLRYVNEDEEKKIDWIANRIVEVYKAKNDEMPSVAIFIGDKENIDDFVEEISDSDVLAGIKIMNGATTNVRKSVRVYHLSDVKGMEFEVAIFHNIDKAIAQDNSGLMRRHLYVGISRAVSHLAATFCQEEGNEDVLKYFDPTATHW